MLINLIFTLLNGIIFGSTRKNTNLMVIAISNYTKLWALINIWRRCAEYHLAVVFILNLLIRSKEIFSLIAYFKSGTINIIAYHTILEIKLMLLLLLLLLILWYLLKLLDLLFLLYILMILQESSWIIFLIRTTNFVNVFIELTIQRYLNVSCRIFKYHILSKLIDLFVRKRST